MLPGQDPAGLLRCSRVFRVCVDEACSFLMLVELADASTAVHLLHSARDFLCNLLEN